MIPDELILQSSIHQFHSAILCTCIQTNCRTVRQRAALTGVQAHKHSKQTDRLGSRQADRQTDKWKARNNLILSQCNGFGLVGCTWKSHNKHQIEKLLFVWYKSCGFNTHFNFLLSPQSNFNIITTFGWNEAAHGPALCYALIKLPVYKEQIWKL